jgi:small subunit ribosomal protein S1
MVDRNLIREFNVNEQELEIALGGSLADLHLEEGGMDGIIDERAQRFDVNQIVDGVILRVDGDEVLVDIGYKSEGIVPTDEWAEDGDPPTVGQTCQVLLEEVEDDYGLILLSKRKADRIREWEKIIQTHSEGDVVTGTVVRKIKGGLLVNIGVNVFLPASQVDIRRPPDIANYIGTEIECVILIVDEWGRNIDDWRRKKLEEKREKMKQELLSNIEEDQLRKGVVKNIADFGAFVDLGGIDGLLHITDMSWGRISHPSEVVKIDEEIEVMILNVDREKEKIALGLKQKFPSPWEVVNEKYPVGTKVAGEVVNVMSYGAFVKLEDGIEGLVHISEMSWTKRINHPTELVNTGDEVDVIVLGINQDKQEISLGMKQTQPNPWDQVAEKYPPGSTIQGTVRNLTNYGAFIELEEGVDGLLHVSDMSWTRKISHANEMLKRGDEVECHVLSVDEDRKRIALGLKQLQADPWETDIPEKYQPGAIVKGKATKITNFGVFVELEDELEGLLHISELADHKVDNPEELVAVGEEIEVRILRVDTVDRKIGLSRKLHVEVVVDEADSSEGDDAESADLREELKGGTGSGTAGPLFTMGGEDDEESAEATGDEIVAEDGSADVATQSESPSESPTESPTESPAESSTADVSAEAGESGESDETLDELPAEASVTDETSDAASEKE